MKTLREKYEARLLELGAKPVSSRSTKYHVFEYTVEWVNDSGAHCTATRFIFLGKAGGVRANERNAYDGSLSQPTWLMRRLNQAHA